MTRRQRERPGENDDLRERREGVMEGRCDRGWMERGKACTSDGWSEGSLDGWMDGSMDGNGERVLEARTKLRTWILGFREGSADDAEIQC